VNEEALAQWELLRQKIKKKKKKKENQANTFTQKIFKQ